MNDEILSQGQVTNDQLRDGIVSSVDKWSSSIWQLRIPSKLFSRSVIVDVREESGKVITATLLYGERKGEVDEIPYDSGDFVNQITDLSTESLWAYDSEKTHGIPIGFQKVKQKNCNYTGVS